MDNTISFWSFYRFLELKTRVWQDTYCGKEKFDTIRTLSEIGTISQAFAWAFSKQGEKYWDKMSRDFDTYYTQTLKDLTKLGKIS